MYSYSTRVVVLVLFFIRALEGLEKEADGLDGGFYDEHVDGFAIGSIAKFGRLGALYYSNISAVYFRKSDQLLEGKDFNLAEECDAAATGAAVLSGDSLHWLKWFPRRYDNHTYWGRLYID